MKKRLLPILICAIYSSLWAQTFEPQPDFFRKQREMPLINLATPIYNDEGKEGLHAIHIFPNPTVDILNVQVNTAYKNPMVHIVDLKGGVLISKVLSGMKKTLDVSLLTQGIYMLYITNENDVILKQKIVKTEKNL